MLKLPSKNFILVVVLTAVLGTGVFVLLNIFKKETTYTQNSKNRVAFSIKSTDDSDNDGLRNWEELLLGTNPFEYDAKASFPVPRGGGTDNITEAFSRELITSLLFSEASTVDDESVARALDTLFKETAKQDTPRVYSETNVRVVKNTKTAFKTYGNTFMETVARHPLANADDTLGTFEHVLKTRDEGAAETLGTIADEYGKLESGLITLSVPQEIAALHVDFINSVHALSQSVRDMGAALKDPLRGTLGLSEYLKQLDRAWDILANIQTVFQKENITFDQNERGYVWVLFQ